MASKGTPGKSSNASGVVHEDPSSLAAAAVAEGGRHVAVLTRETIDEWHRRLESAGTLPADRHFVSVDDTVRSAAAPDAGPRTRRLGEGVRVSVADRPLSQGFLDFLDASLAPADSTSDADASGSLVVDDPGVLVGDGGPSLEGVAAAAADAGVALHLGVPDDDAVAAALWRRFRPVDDATGRRLAAAALRHLRDTDPTNFGYLRRHWREARRGMEAVEMTYPQAKQVHAAIPDPETTPRTLGATLQAFVKLGALGVWGTTVAASRYDMTGYDPERVAVIGEALDD